MLIRRFSIRTTRPSVVLSNRIVSDHKKYSQHISASTNFLQSYWSKWINKIKITPLSCNTQGYICFIYSIFESPKSEKWNYLVFVHFTYAFFLRDKLETPLRPPLYRKTVSMSSILTVVLGNGIGSCKVKKEWCMKHCIKVPRRICTSFNIFSEGGESLPNSTSCLSSVNNFLLFHWKRYWKWQIHGKV